MSIVEELMSKLIRATRVLLVEDDPGVALAFSAALRSKYVCEIDWAATGEQAVDFVCRFQDYDIIFLDLLLPKMSGVEVLKVVKSKLPVVPVVVMSGYIGGDLWLEAIKLGVVGGISKPFTDINFDELFRTFKIRARTKDEAAYFATGTASLPTVASAV
jgi:CheY-like chemotaxis protein